MTAPILNTVFRNLSDHQRLRAPEGMLALVKLINTPYNIYGSDGVELMRIYQHDQTPHAVASSFSLAISHDLAELNCEYDADADHIHEVLQSEPAARLSDLDIGLRSIYVRPPAPIDTTYAMVTDKAERLVLLTMKGGLQHIGPDQVEISVRGAFAKRYSSLYPAEGDRRQLQESKGTSTQFLGLQNFRF